MNGSSGQIFRENVSFVELGRTTMKEFNDNDNNNNNDNNIDNDNNNDNNNDLPTTWPLIDIYRKKNMKKIFSQKVDLI